MLPFIWYFKNKVVLLHRKKGKSISKFHPFLLYFRILIVTNVLAYNMLRAHGRKKFYTYDRK